MVLDFNWILYLPVHRYTIAIHNLYEAICDLIQQKVHDVYF